MFTYFLIWVYYVCLLDFVIMIAFFLLCRPASHFQNRSPGPHPCPGSPPPGPGTPPPTGPGQPWAALGPSSPALGFEDFSNITVTSQAGFLALSRLAGKGPTPGSAPSQSGPDRTSFQGGGTPLKGGCHGQARPPVGHPGVNVGEPWGNTLRPRGNVHR